MNSCPWAKWNRTPRAASSALSKFARLAIVLLLLGAFSDANAVALPEAVQCLKGIRRDGISEGALNALVTKLPNFFGKAKNKSGLLLADYSQHNNNKRVFLIDLERCLVVYRMRATHGGRWYIFRDAKGRVLPDSTGYHSYDTISPGDPVPTDYLKTCTNPTNGGRQHMTRPGFSKTGGCHKTGLTGWTTLWKQGSTECHGIVMKPLEPGKQGSMAGVVIHEHTRMKPDTVGQGCIGTMPGHVTQLMRESEKSGFDIRKETLIYTYAPQCGE